MDNLEELELPFVISHAKDKLGRRTYTIKLMGRVLLKNAYKAKMEDFMRVAKHVWVNGYMNGLDKTNWVLKDITVDLDNKTNSYFLRGNK